MEILHPLGWKPKNPTYFSRGSVKDFVPDFFVPLQHPGTIIDSEVIEDNNEQRLNIILDKIHQSGIESLTKEEKLFLNQNSK